MHFVGLNLKTMTDQELTDKISEINKRLSFSGKFSLDGYLIEQLRNMQEACLFEARERVNQRVFEEMNKTKTDEKDLTPEPKVKTVAKTNSASPHTSGKREGGFRVSRSSSPTRS